MAGAQVRARMGARDAARGAHGRPRHRWPGEPRAGATRSAPRGGGGGAPVLPRGRLRAAAPALLGTRVGVEAHGCHEPLRCAERGAARGGERAVTPQPGEVGRATSLLGGTATPAAHARRPPAREELPLGRANRTVPLPLPLPLPVTRTNPHPNPSAHPNHASWGWCAWLWVALRSLRERPCRWKAAARPARPAASASKSPIYGVLLSRPRRSRLCRATTLG